MKTSAAAALILTWTSHSQDRTSGYGAVISWAHTVTTWRSNTVTHWNPNAPSATLKDGKGRDIGNYAVIESRPKWLEASKAYSTTETSYSVWTQATRNGRGFGAINTNRTKCATLEAAQALAAEKIVAAGKRFARAVAKGEGRQFAKGA